MQKKYFLFVVLFFFLSFVIGCGGVSIAQNRNIDSLLTLLETDNPDTNKVNHLNKLTSEYLNIGEYNSALKYANKSLALASSIPVENKRGWAEGIATAYNNIGIIYYYQNNFPAALKKCFSALKIGEDNKVRKIIANSYNIIGVIYNAQAKYQEALKSHFTTLKIREDIGDKGGIADSFNNIGMIYNDHANYPEALKNHFASLKIREEIGDRQGIAMSYNNIGIIFGFQGNYVGALNNHILALKMREEIGDKPGIADSYNNIGIIYGRQTNYKAALTNHYASLNIKKLIGDKQGIAMSYTNIGAIYEKQNNFTEALKHFLASLKIGEEIGDKFYVASSFYNIGDMQLKLHDIKASKDYLNKALQLSKEINSKDDIKNSYNLLAKLDSIQGNWKEAYLHHKLFVVYRDSIDNEETRKKTTEIILTNKFEKQEAATKAEQDKKDTIATANKKRQQLILILVSCVLIFVFIFAGFVVRSLRITRKQKNIIEFQKNEVSHQKEIVLEKNKEITDSINYAQRIQRALLASNTMLDENLSNKPHPAPPEGRESQLTNQSVLDIQGSSPPLRGGREELGSNYFIFFQPKDIVSGDFYWASSLANGNFALVTADSTGHGVPGAIMSMLNISCLNEAVKGQQLTEPNEILNYTRNKIIEHLSNDGSADGGKDGMDCSLISFEFDDLKMENGNKTSDSQYMTKLTYSAANNPIWIVKSSKPGKPGLDDVSELIELKPDKMPVGKHERDKIPFTQQTIELQKGDIVYTLTDGMPDQFGGSKGKKFMAKQLKELLLNSCHLPMNEQKEKLAAAFNLWKGNLEQVDDVCIIGVKI